MRARFLEVAAPYRDWIAAPEKPLRYRFRDRIKDIVTGRADGKRGIPAIPAAFLTDDGPHAIDTATLRELRWEADEIVKRHKVEYEVHRVALRKKNTAVYSSITPMTERLDVLTQAVREAEKEPDFNQIRIGDRGRSREFSRRRRLAEQAKQIREARARRQEGLREFAEMSEEIAGVDLAERALAEAVRLRNDAVRAYYERRAAAYWRSVIRTHPRGVVLNDRVRPLGATQQDLPTLDPLATEGR